MDPTKFLVFCAGISCIGGAAGYIFKLYHTIYKKQAGQEAMEQKIEFIENEVKDNNVKLESLSHDNKIQFRLLISLTDHMLTGNHEDELQRLKGEMLTHLTE